MIHNFVEDEVFTDSMNFGQFIRKKRRLMGLNQADFADILGFNQKAISYWESGKRTPNYSVATYIIKFLGGEVKIVNQKSPHECKTLTRELLDRFPSYPVERLFFGDDSKLK